MNSSGYTFPSDYIRIELDSKKYTAKLIFEEIGGVSDNFNKAFLCNKIQIMNIANNGVIKSNSLVMFNTRYSCKIKDDIIYDFKKWNK